MLGSPFGNGSAADHPGTQASKPSMMTFRSMGFSSSGSRLLRQRRPGRISEQGGCSQNAGRNSWAVDLVYISFAQALLVWRLLEGEGATPGSEAAGERPYAGAWQKRTHPARAAVTLFLLLASIVISNIVFFNLFGDRFHYGFYGFIFWADLLLLVASYVVLLPPALRQIWVSPAAAFDFVR